MAIRLGSEILREALMEKICGAGSIQIPPIIRDGKRRSRRLILMARFVVLLRDSRGRSTRQLGCHDLALLAKAAGRNIRRNFRLSNMKAISRDILAESLALVVFTIYKQSDARTFGYRYHHVGTRGRGLFSI